MTKGPGTPEDSIDASPFAVAIVASKYNATIVDRMVADATQTFADYGGRPEKLTCIRAPGAYELPVLSAECARSGRFDAIVALGCLIKGETVHDRVIADAVASGLICVSIETGVPALFGVLTVDTIQQAEARAGDGSGGKGAEAMIAAIETATSLAAIKSKSNS